MSCHLSSSSRLALGTAQFGLDYGVANQKGRLELSEIRSVLGLAADNQIDTIDTAMTYGNAENRLGELGVDTWKVVTKLPPIPLECQDVERWVFESVERSLKLLKKASLYGLLLHQPGQLLDGCGEALHRSMQKLKIQKLVQKIGISVYDPTELGLLVPCFDLDLVQAPLNIFDRRLIDSGWLARLASSNIEVHARSIFLQGLLLMPAEQRPSKFAQWVDVLHTWDQFLLSETRTAVELCIAYAASFPEVSRLVVGVDTVDQLREIINSLTKPLLGLPTDLSVSDPKLLNPSQWPK